MLEHKPQVQTYNDLFKMIRGHFGMRMSHPSRAKWKDFHIIFVSAIFLLLLFKCQIHLQLLLPRRSMRDCVYLLYYYLYVRLFYAWFLCFIFQFRLLHEMVTDVGGATKIADDHWCTAVTVAIKKKKYKLIFLSGMLRWPTTTHQHNVAFDTSQANALERRSCAVAGCCPRHIPIFCVFYYCQTFPISFSPLCRLTIVSSGQIIRVIGFAWPIQIHIWYRYRKFNIEIANIKNGKFVAFLILSTSSTHTLSGTSFL